MKLSEIFKNSIEIYATKRKLKYDLNQDEKENYILGAEYFANEITPKVAFRFLQYCDNIFYYDTENERFIDLGSDEVYTFEQVWEHFLNNVKFS